MNKRMAFAALTLALLSFVLPALSETRALLVACSDFLTQPDLGSSISGNLHMIGSALISADVSPGALSIEDGTIGSVQALEDAAQDAFAESNEDDLSILYLCTHGVLSSADDEQVYLLLGDGQSENPLSAAQLCSILGGVQGEKLLILDACFSGALIGRGMPEGVHLPGARPEPSTFFTPFLRDPSIHVLTSASGSESSWYYDGQGLETGAVSYFASALASGLGLYGEAEADLLGDGTVTLAELHRYLNEAVPSSSSQLLSARAEQLLLPVASGMSLPRALTGFSYDESLLSTQDPTLSFSFTVTRDDVHVQYRLIDFENGRWNWENAKVFVDEGDAGDMLLSTGRKARSLMLQDVAEDESGYLMLQVFAVSGDTLTLCSERLIAVQPAQSQAELTIQAPQSFSRSIAAEFPIDVQLDVPAELTVSVFSADGALVRRLASGQMTRPSAGSVTHLYWDGLDAKGVPAAPGRYAVTAEAYVGGRRQKAAVDILIQ